MDIEEKTLNRFWFISKITLLFWLFAGGITLFAYMAGQWLPRYDLKIEEMGICESNSEFTPLSTRLRSATYLYICGRTTGTTFRHVRFYLFKDESIIYQSRIRLDPGTFYVDLPRPAQKVTYYPGRYRIEAHHGRLLAFQTAFEIEEVR